MNISQINNLVNYQKSDKVGNLGTSENGNTSFDNMFQALVNQVDETNNYSNAAQQEEMAYSLGLTNNTSDLMVAQQKANLSLQYTVAIRNHVMDAYKEIMNLQF